jgi:prolyl oligopeptidase
MRKVFALLATVALIGGIAVGTARGQTVTASSAEDPYIWLEDAHGDRAMDWVKAENAKTLGVLEKDPNFAGLDAQALAIGQAKDRIPAPNMMRGKVYNFWRDADHVRGILRYTSLADYQSPTPHWQTAFDLDALAEKEHANWVFSGLNCHRPSERRCLISLSDGGEDAITVREFDLVTQTFVDGGFSLPRAKQNVTWENDDTLLVSRPWEPNEVTSSGYPYVLKRLKRGQSLDAATEVFRGSASDALAVSPGTLDDGRGHHVAFVRRGVTFFTAEYHLLTPSGLRTLNIPPKVSPSGLIAGRLLLTLNQDWPVAGTTFRQGSLVAVDLAATLADPEHLTPRLVFAPGEREAIQNVVVTKSHLLLVVDHNVTGRALVFTPAADGGWSTRALAFPENSAIAVADASLDNDDAFFNVTGYLTPTSLWQVDAATGALATVKALPSQFDASKDVVEQFEATSSDGTRIPYFIVHPKTMQLDGTNPTVLYAYGGFQVSLTPNYSATVGKLWLERGGVYVVANIRGGGEFGPAWHEAGLKTHRQRIYDDFTAVAKDLIARKITTPRHLGIEGGSNGGLLMGVEFTQHPELWNAVDIQVPLLDMLRFEKIAAGASWVGEYGSVSVPEERAFLASISPYNNLKAGVKYPEALIWSTTKDDRVGPQHARKFSAKLAAMGVPYYYYEVIEGGHGSGANAQEQAHTTAIEWTYFTRKLMN